MSTRSKVFLTVAAGHFLSSVALFIFFGIGLEGRSFGSDLFWYIQEPVAGLNKYGLFPDLYLLNFPVNSLIWGFAARGIYVATYG